MLDIAQLMAASKPKARRQENRLERIPVAAPCLVSRASGPPLPGVAQGLAEVLGTERALYLIGQLPRFWSGSEGRKSLQPMLSVPKRLTAGHMLVQLLGWADAQALVDAFGGECLKPPTCSGIYRAFRDRQILAMRAEGLSAQLVADAVGVTERWVCRVTRFGNSAR